MKIFKRLAVVCAAMLMATMTAVTVSAEEEKNDNIIVEEDNTNDTVTDIVTKPPVSGAVTQTPDTGDEDVAGVIALSAISGAAILFKRRK